MWTARFWVHSYVEWVQYLVGLQHPTQMIIQHIHHSIWNSPLIKYQLQLKYPTDWTNWCCLQTYITPPSSWNILKQTTSLMSTPWSSASFSTTSDWIPVWETSSAFVFDGWWCVVYGWHAITKHNIINLILLLLLVCSSKRLLVPILTMVINLPVIVDLLSISIAITTHDKLLGFAILPSYMSSSVCSILPHPHMLLYLCVAQ